MGSGRANAWISYRKWQEKAKELHPEIAAQYEEVFKQISQKESFAFRTFEMVETRNYVEYSNFIQAEVKPLQVKLNELYDQLYAKPKKENKK